MSFEEQIKALWRLGRRTSSSWDDLAGDPADFDQLFQEPKESETRFRISHNNSQAIFWPVIVDSDKGYPLGIRVHLGLPEPIAHPVTYTMQDRITGTLVERVRALMDKRRLIRKGETIMVFALPPNDRGVEYVAFHQDFIEVLD